MEVKMACKAGAHDGAVRCRNMQPCVIHPDGEPTAPEADVILVKMNLNGKWGLRWKSAGVRTTERSGQRAATLAKQRKAQAEQFNRSPLAVRRQSGSDISVPEAMDSGTPIFGPDGLAGVDITGLAEELHGMGNFLLADVHILKRPWKAPDRLVLEFNKIGPALQNFPWRIYHELIATCFGKVHVWANPRNVHGNVAHTVNCGERNDGGRPQYRLRYKEGDWGVSEI